MKEKLKEKWLRLYFLANQIAAFDPWEDFAEKDRFTYIWKDKSKEVYFSFISDLQSVLELRAMSVLKITCAQEQC